MKRLPAHAFVTTLLLAYGRGMAAASTLPENIPDFSAGCVPPRRPVGSERE